MKSFLTTLVLILLIVTGCADTGDQSDGDTEGIVVGTGGTDGETGGPGTDTTAPVEVVGDGKTNLTMSFTDAPIDDADSVTIGIKKIEIRKGACGTVSESCDAAGDATGDATSDACEYVEYFSAADESEEQVIDLLEFRNGATFLFETVQLDEGEYCQFRFYLSEETGKNTITLIEGSEATELEINSGIRNNGLKLVSGLVLEDGVESEILVDFDVRKSIVLKGGKNNPRYALKPTIRIVQTNSTGNLTLTSDIVSSAGEVFYLYEQDFDVTNEADTTVIDGMGTDATSDDEEVDQPYANAVSSAVADDTLTAVFLGIPFGIYDLYNEDASGDSLTLVQEDIQIQ